MSFLRIRRRGHFLDVNVKTKICILEAFGKSSETSSSPRRCVRTREIGHVSAVASLLK